jgi:hypothetical protein
MSDDAFTRLDPRRRWLWDRALVVAVVAGILFRLAQWLSGHPVWHDEWMLLWNVEHKTAAELMGRLEMNQGAPPLYLLMLRGLYVVFGESQIALRLPAVVAGSGALVVMGLLCRRLVGGPGAVLAVAAMALSDRMIWHAAEIKPYSIDVLVALSLAYAAVTLSGMSRVVALAGIAAVGMWVSYATVFAFAGVMLAMVPDVRRDWRGTLRWLACCAVAGASFLAVYFLVARGQRTAHLEAAWEHEYVPWGQAWLIPFWFVRRTLELCGYAAENLGPIFMVLGIVGAVVWWRVGRRREAGVVLWPIAVVLAASAVPKYPYGGSRATLFLIPGVFLLAGVGLEVVRSRARGVVQRFWWVPLAVVVGVMLVPDLYHVVVPRVRTPVIKPLAGYVAEYRKEGDAIYVASRDGYPAEFISYWGTRGGTFYTRHDRDLPADLGRFWFVAVTRNKEEVGAWLKEIGIDERAVVERGRYEIKGGTAILFEKPT